MTADRYIIKSCKKSKNWEEGFFSVNGSVGAIVFGNPRCERIIINHEELFLKTDSVKKLPNMKDVFKKAREPTASGKGIETAELFYNKARERGLKNAEGLYPDRYFPALQMDIHYLEETEKGYERRLNTYTSEIDVRAEYDEFCMSKWVFTSIKENLVCISQRMLKFAPGF